LLKEFHYNFWKLDFYRGLYPLFLKTNWFESILSKLAPEGIYKFTEVMNVVLCYLENSGPAQLLQLILEKSGYLSDLLSVGTEESEDRRNNLQELINAATQYEEETESGDVEGFLSTAALTTDNDKYKNYL